MEIGKRYWLDDYYDVSGIFSPTKEHPIRFTEIKGEGYLRDDDGSILFTSDCECFEEVQP